MSDSEGSAVTYTSVYTDSEPGRVFWGTDEEVSEGGVPRVIVYGYDGFPIQPVPQDEDEREPRFIEVHDTDFVPEHVFPAEEQPLPPVDSPTAESPGYIAESDPEEDPEYEDDEEQDGPVDYPMGGGDDGGDDDGDSSGDDADDEDEDMEKDDEDEELHSRNSVMSDSEGSAVTYTSVYTDSEPGRVFWGTDEEVSEGGVPRVIVYGYDGFPIQPVPQDEDEREPAFIQAHNPDFVPEPMYPEYVPLEDDHILPAEEQPLPPVDSPTAESPGYVAESDPEEDPEYEDDEEQDGPVDYPMGGGDDGGDDDGDSSGDDADDEDEDMEKEEEDEEEEEEHIALADSTAVIPIVELVSSPKRIDPIIPPLDITTTGARIFVRLQASVSLPSTADVERLLALPTPPLSPLTSLSPPTAGERLARLTDPPIHPSPSLPQSSVNHRDKIPESEIPPRKRSCLFAIGSRYEAGGSSTTRPTRGQGTDYGFVSTVDMEARRQGIRDVGYGIRDTWIDPAES
ncbi:hypothetical protein Tco_1100217 [Tanacetum coccineum]